jgi:prolyl-tRNA editing enzyme YbaK/EbsC (Cys-tRNA(Pro) deacylase)
VQTSWPEPVERVAAFLREAGAEARLEEFEAGTRTAEDAARAAGCSVAQIVKSMVVVCDGSPVLAMVPGDRRADLGKVAAAAGGSSARIARGDEVEQATGVAPGGVSPFVAPRVDRVFVDRTLLGQDLVWVGAGSPSHVAAVRPGELVRLTRAQPIDAVQEPDYPST